MVLLSRILLIQINFDKQLLLPSIDNSPSFVVLVCVDLLEIVVNHLGFSDLRKGRAIGGWDEQSRRNVALGVDCPKVDLLGDLLTGKKGISAYESTGMRETSNLDGKSVRSGSISISSAKLRSAGESEKVVEFSFPVGVAVFIPCERGRKVEDVGSGHTVYVGGTPSLVLYAELMSWARY